MQWPLPVAELVDNTHFEKSLRLVISFGSLKRAQFVHALEERLKPALEKVRAAGSLKHLRAGNLGLKPAGFTVSCCQAIILPTC